MNTSQQGCMWVLVGAIPSQNSRYGRRGIAEKAGTHFPEWTGGGVGVWAFRMWRKMRGPY